MKNIAIIGSGSWGTALAIHLAKMGNLVRIWSFAEDEMNLINNYKKCKFLPKVELPNGILCSQSYEEVITGSDIVLHVTPSKFTRSTVKEYKKFITNQPVIMCSKGFEKETGKMLLDVLEEEMPLAKTGIFAGPSHAEEVSVGIPTAIVIASKYKEVQELIQKEFMNENLRVYTSSDVKGVELGGAVKNVIAFCAGAAAGLNLGDNSFAALITRGLVEMKRLGEAMHINTDTLYGLTGLGDLIVTCLSEHSRNRTAGFLIGKGNSISYVKEKIGMTIESIDNIEAVKKLADTYNVEMPIINTVYDVLNNNLEPEKAVKILMTRTAKSE